MLRVTSTMCPLFVAVSLATVNSFMPLAYEHQLLFNSLLSNNNKERLTIYVKLKGDKKSRLLQLTSTQIRQ